MYSSLRKYFDDILEKAEPPPMKIGDISPISGNVAKIHPNGKILWHANPERATTHDRIINNPEMRQKFLNKIPSPKHKAAMSIIMDRVAKDPLRHFVPTYDTPGVEKHSLRARHIKSLLSGDPNYTIDVSKPDRLNLTALERHGNDKRPTLWSFPIKEKQSVKKSERNDEGRASERYEDLQSIRLILHDGDRGLGICDEYDTARTSGIKRTEEPIGRSNLYKTDNIAPGDLDSSNIEFGKPSDTYNQPVAKTLDWRQSYLMHVKPDQSKSHKDLPANPVEALKFQLLHRGWLTYNPKKGFIRNRRIVDRGDNKPLMAKNEEGPIKLIHYSAKQGLQSLEPQFQGSGVKDAGAKYAKPVNPYTSFYKEGSPTEDLVTENAKSKYETTLHPHQKIYDLASDKDNIVKDAIDQNQGIWNQEVILSAIKERGYHGFHNSSHPQYPGQVALFYKMPVESEEKYV